VLLMEACCRCWMPPMVPWPASALLCQGRSNSHQVRIRYTAATGALALPVVAAACFGCW
jgi:hypothetical protein